MEVSVSQKPGHLPSDVASDSGKKEISEGEDEDDDKNHKHRKREAHSQSFDGDCSDHPLSRPYRKRNRSFENGHSSQSGETWKSSDNFSGRESSSSIERRHQNHALYSRVPMDFNQRISRNQPLLIEAGSGRGRGRGKGRGRGLGAWGLQLDSSDLASQFVLPGPVPSGLFSGGGMSNVSNSQSTSWNPFGLIPGVPNGGMDVFHSLSLQATLGPPISLRQRCGDFEELGFCMRGDLCPMEHGINRIVIDDVQGLSQFNLSVSVPGPHLTSSGGQENLPAIASTSGSIVNSNTVHAKSSLDMTDSFVGESLGVGSDVYDPDQPLWTNDNPATSTLLSFNQSNVNNMESLMDKDPNDRSNTESARVFDEHLVRRAATAGFQSSSVRGRIGSSKNRSGLKEKSDVFVKSPSRDMNEKVLNNDNQDNSFHEERIKLNNDGPPDKELSQKTRSVQNPPHKALCTLFVNGIPWKDNKKEALACHFQKFGVVRDIYIPKHSEKAFVQFSKREEAEAALKAPDAVMGNRFIKLWWANRDNVPDDGMNGLSDVSVTSHGGMTPTSDVSHPPLSNKGRKDVSADPSVSQGLVYDHSRVVMGNDPKAPPIQQKKLENLELLKEELRKKRQMLDQKRNEFRRQLDRLEKQTTVFKDVATDQSPKTLQSETPPDSAKGDTALSLMKPNIVTENVGSAENDVPHVVSSNATVVREHSSLKPSIRSAPVAATYVTNRFKLDNRPTAFKIVSQLPLDLANAMALEEHFSSYGDLLSVELEDLQLIEASDQKLSSSISARIFFRTRQSAEKAFSHGKSWRGHSLQFTWLTANNSCKESGVSGTPLADSKMPEEIEVTPMKGNGEPAEKSCLMSDNQNEE